MQSDDMPFIILTAQTRDYNNFVALHTMMQAVALILLSVVVIGRGGVGGVLAFTSPFISSSHTSSFQRTKCDGSQSENDIGIRSKSSTSFEDLGLSSELIEVTQRMNWYKPTPVQQLALPAILQEMSDENTSALWCEGPTGSGKTGGFALPLLQLIIESKRTSAGRGSIQGQGKINTLILCPTRELAAQESFLFAFV